MDLLQALASPEHTLVRARTLVVVAHPDDEVVGAGSRLSRLRDAWFVYVTDGAPRNGHDAARHGLDVEGYCERRRAVRVAALALCGIGQGRILDLDCPDQEAALQLPALSRTLAGFIAAQRIEAIVTQPYEGGHPDHDATAFAVHAATRLSRASCAGCASAIFEMTSYHAGAAGIALCEFIANDGVDARQVT